ncbi:MAG: radical SAM protein [candidate division Zixibacteria bacterium]|nr:radical SAM protein [candidate division Zixibacteria bacterium]
MKDYPRYITSGFPPFDPIQLAKMTEVIVCPGSSRKYTAFYKVGVYGGISTGYTVGCCLRCIYCWVEWSRDFPESHGKFFTPQQVFQNLLLKAKKKRVSKLRISGGEPTICKDHLLQVLEFVKTTNYLFMLETNGILLGYDQDYPKELDRFRRNLHVRVSLKAGTAEGFQRRTGAVGKFYELPYLAIKNLSQTNLEFHVACMSDPKVMPKEERVAMLQKLKEVGYRGYLEEEYCDPYPTSVVRLEKAGYHLFEGRL